MTVEPGVTEVRALFREYVEELGIDLSFQDFDQELCDLPGVYAAPTGILLLCRVSSQPAGCVALRKWQGGTAELKRMFIRARYRGLGYGSLLAAEAVVAARVMGYERILLDTLSSMAGARRVYERLGFRETSPYYSNPLEDVIFMELVLSDIKADFPRPIRD